MARVKMKDDILIFSSRDRKNKNKVYVDCIGNTIEVWEERSKYDHKCLDGNAYADMSNMIEMVNTYL